MKELLPSPFNWQQEEQLRNTITERIEKELSGKIGITLQLLNQENILGNVWSIDLNMVRAGVVGHLSKWKEGGYQELQNPLSII